MLNQALALIALGVIAFYTICDEVCIYLKGTVFGLELQYVGMAFMAVLMAVSALKKDLCIMVMLSVAIGVEVFLVGYQIRYGVYCPYCLIFGGSVLLLFLINIQRRRLKMMALITILSLLLFPLFFNCPTVPVYG